MTLGLPTGHGSNQRIDATLLRIFIGSRDKKLYVLDLRTGQSAGEFTAGRAITASPAIGEGVVVIGDTAGDLYCLEPK